MTLDTTSKKMLAVTDINSDLGYIPYNVTKLPLYDINRCLMREEIEGCAEYNIKPSKESLYEYNELVPLCDIDKTNMFELGFNVANGLLHPLDDGSTFKKDIRVDLHLVYSGNHIVKNGVLFYDYNEDLGVDGIINGIKSIAAEDYLIDYSLEKITFKVDNTIGDDLVFNVSSTIALEVNNSTVSSTMSFVSGNIELTNFGNIPIRQLINNPNYLSMRYDFYFTESLTNYCDVYVGLQQFDQINNGNPYQINVEVLAEYEEVGEDEYFVYLPVDVTDVNYDYAPSSQAILLDCTDSGDGYEDVHTQGRIYLNPQGICSEYDYNNGVMEDIPTDKNVVLKIKVENYDGLYLTNSDVHARITTPNKNYNPSGMFERIITPDDKHEAQYGGINTFYFRFNGCKYHSLMGSSANIYITIDLDNGDTPSVS